MAEAANGGWVRRAASGDGERAAGGGGDRTVSAGRLDALQDAPQGILDRQEGHQPTPHRKQPDATPPP